jgi:hypothetical protein
MKTGEYNKVWKGFLWGMVFWIPFLGQMFYAYRVYRVGKGPVPAKRAAFIALLWTLCFWSLPYVADQIGKIGVSLFLGFGLAGFIAIFIIGTKQIGWRFFAGKLLTTLAVISILAAIAIPNFIDRRQKVAKLHSEQYQNEMVLPSEERVVGYDNQAHGH